MEDPPLSAVAALLCDTQSGLLLCVRFVESTALDWLLNDEIGRRQVTAVDCRCCCVLLC